MRTTLIIDDNLLERAREYTGIKEKTSLVRAGIEELIARGAARHLALLEGSLPQLRPTLHRPPRPGKFAVAVLSTALAAH